MNADSLLAHYEKVADAPNAIARLRRFILDLAVRGKLLPQNPKDDPASELLKQIAKEKARLVTTGEIRNPKPIPALSETPFSIPPSWRWSQIAEIGVLSLRNQAPDATEASFVPMPLIAAEYGVANEHEVRPWGEIKKGYTHFAEGDVGLAKITPCFENGKSTIFRNLAGGIGSGTTELHIVRPLFADPDYILIFLKSPHFIETGIPKMTGTAGQKRVPTDYFAHSPFPLPPLAEQHRIVAKVDELMGLCDRLEIARGSREAVRDRLAAASLARLNAPAPETFHDDARFALDALPALTTRSDQIDQFRQTILGLAMRGKLVPQNPNDQPAAELLRQIAAQKQLPTKVVKIAGDEFRHDPAAQFELPTSWQVIPLSDLLISSFYGPRFGTDEYSATGIPTIRTTDMTSDGRIVLRNPPRVTVPENRLQDFRCLSGDLLVTRSGSIGTMAIFDADYIAIPSAYLIRLRFSPLISVRYIHLSLRSPDGQEALGLGTTRVAQPNINARTISAIPIRPPPLGRTTPDRDKSR
jgi:type I restriction enzyme S subunit